MSLTAHPFQSRGRLEAARYPLLSDLGDEARSGSNRLIRTFSSLLARVRQLLLWHCVSSFSRAHDERGRFRPVKASATFCVLVAYTDTQKV
jgi:hypothetical protein